MVKPLCVTVMVTVAFWPWESVTLTLHVPPRWPVTASCHVGPLALVAENVAIGDSPFGAQLLVWLKSPV
jgi:hypothetical protein